jgi:hypothetical protein
MNSQLLPNGAARSLTATARRAALGRIRFQDLRLSPAAPVPERDIRPVYVKELPA